MENQHPSAEQLCSYMESPESREHGEVRRHLMACDECRVRIDNLSQLEMDIKHIVPRLAANNDLIDDTEQRVEQFVDQQHTGEQNQSLEEQIKSDPQTLKSALHYAVHSAAMSRNLQTMDNKPAVAATSSTVTPTHVGFHQLLNRIKQSLQWSMPAWTLAPASIAIAALISFVLVSNPVHEQQTVQLATYQDNATITFERTGMPAGSIGFFHDAQSSTKPFAGIKIAINRQAEGKPGKSGKIEYSQLVFQWPAVEKAQNYELSIYYYQDSEKQLLAQQTSGVTQVSFDNLKLNNGQHYEWQLSGNTENGLKFNTKGDFVYLESVNK